MYCNYNIYTTKTNKLYGECQKPENSEKWSIRMFEFKVFFD